MKTLRCVLMLMGLLIGMVSICMAEDWYAAIERSSNDYRGSVGSMVADTDGSKYAPNYTSAELRDTRAVADMRQISQTQSETVVAQVSQSLISEAEGDGPTDGRVVSMSHGAGPAGE